MGRYEELFGKIEIISQNVNNEVPRHNKHGYSKEYFLLCVFI
mgnify:CR=1 FL=1